MKVEIKLISGRSLRDIIEPALKSKGFATYSVFAKLVADKTGASEHAELNRIGNVLKGKTERVSSGTAKAYADILGIPEKDLLDVCGAGNYYRNDKTVVIEDGAVITAAVKNLAGMPRITMEDFVKEILYRLHQ